MSFVLAAFIGNEATVSAAGALVGAHRTSRLGRNLHLVELSPDSIEESGFPGRFYNLTAKLAAAAAAASVIGDIGYIEADFFGGEGSQSCMAWRDHEVIFGPLRADHEEPPVPRLSDWPINQALRFFGVEAKPEMDEFRTVDLGRFR